MLKIFVVFILLLNIIIRSFQIITFFVSILMFTHFPLLLQLPTSMVYT